MNDSQTVLGFTAAEVGFVLALIFLALFVAASASTTQDKPTTAENPVVIPQDSLERLATRLGALERRGDSLQAQLDAAAKKRSNLTPPCTELGLAAGPIGDVVILGSDAFSVNG